MVTINPQRGIERTRDDIAGLDLDAVVGTTDDLAALVAGRRPRSRPSPSTTSAQRPAGRSRRSRRLASRRRMRDPAWRCACSPAAPPARRSASTSPTTPSSGCCSAPSTTRRTRRRRTRLRVRASRSSTRRWCTSAACSASCSASTTAGRSRCSSGSRSTAGTTPCAATAPATVEPGAHRAADGARGRPRSRRAGAASGRSCAGTAPLSPDDADAFYDKYGIPVLISYAATEFGGPVAGWNLADHAEHWKAKRGSVGPGPPGLRAAHRRRGRRPGARARRGRPARGEGRPARRRQRLDAHHRPGPHRRRRLPLDPRAGRPGHHPRRLQGAARRRAGRPRVASRRARAPR